MEKSPKIRIVSKLLASGNHQVKFFVEDEVHPRYGYLLVQGDRAVSDVIDEIRERMELMERSNIDLNRFSFKSQWRDDHNFYLYSA
ncbi:hypothetical protein FKX85_18645 [Echinicola soli]|uniref:Uncharacterized protein n=1 Tax=Echinicola soli TaxID=2591634 RepID=A0A514CM94_9BACT|nr:hypothetical protein [Echinicola soli]QDH80952.1 hypothetical protein FKX85_18645 [Echinicola soli]